MQNQFHEHISRLTLTIKNREIERAYQLHIGRSLLWFRMAILLGIVCIFGFCILDYFLFPDLLVGFLKVRVFYIAPLLALAFFLTFWKGYPQHAQLINVLTITLCGAGIIIMGYIGRDHAEISRSYAGLVPFFMYIYAFLRIRFINGAMAGTSLLIAYAVIEAQFLNTPTNVAIANTIYMSASNFAGMCVAYLLEYQGKKEYLLQEKLADLSVKDALTGLYNRHYFYNVCLKDIEDFIDMNAEGFIDRRNANPPDTHFGLILLDIDHFKRVNDTYGHDVGDNVLIEISKVLEMNVRKTDVVLRWGGEEFLIILKHTQKVYIDDFVLKIGQGIQNHVFDIANGKEIKINCSIGYLSLPFGEQQEPHLLFRYIDQAMYKSKHLGRNRGCQVLMKKGQIEYQEINWN